MTQQLDRIFRLTIYRPDGSEFFTPLTPVTTIFGLTANGIAITELRVQFEIEKTLKSAPNKCEITITNLAQHTRAEVSRKPLVYQLEAGYDGVLNRIYSGDLRHAYSEIKKADWETKAQCGDGDRAYKFASVNRTYNDGATVGTIVADIAKKMDLRIPDDFAGSAAARAVFNTGETTSGPARDELTRLLSPYGFEWSIQDGKLLILHTSKARSLADSVISLANGMEGSPKWTTPEKAGKASTLKVTNRLYPQLQPGQTVTVESRDTSGRFKLTKVTHKGDTHGKEWSTEVECDPL